MRRRPSPQPRGFALLIVLWSVVVLAVLATVLTASGRNELQLAGNLRRAAAAQAAADAGVSAAIFHASDLPARAWPADEQPHVIPVGRYRVTVRVADENGKLNPNYAPPALMAGLLAALGVDRGRAATLAQAFVDWHSIGDLTLVAQTYQQADAAAAPTGRPFRSVDELGLVLGMTPDVLARMRPYVSVYTDGPLELGRAAPLVQQVARTVVGVEAQPAAPRATVVSIVAEADGADGSRFVRHAVVSLAPDRAGRPFHQLQWDTRPTL